MPTVNIKTKVVTSMLNMFYLDVGRSTTPSVFGPSKIIIIIIMIIMTIIFNNSSVLPSLDTYLSVMSLHNYLKEDNA